MSGLQLLKNHVRTFEQSYEARFPESRRLFNEIAKEYTARVQAAKALGVRPLVIMFRHVLPNAMVATLTMLPFIVTGAIGSLAALDFLGFGLPSSAPSLGELTLQAKQNLQAPWLGLTAFTVFAMLLALLVFIFEGVRDAFDPRKTFA